MLATSVILVAVFHERFCRISADIFTPKSADGQTKSCSVTKANSVGRDRKRSGHRIFHKTNIVKIIDVMNLSIAEKLK